jgi:hypothetical protein
MLIKVILFSVTSALPAIIASNIPEVNLIRKHESQLVIAEI